MFTEDELFAAATGETGLTDFGDDNFREGLSVLLKSYNEEAQMTPLGKQLVHSELVGDLTGRLKVVDQLKKNPAIRETSLKRPIFILGLPRTGTTTIHNMLQQNPDCQVLEYWLGVVPQSRPARELWDDNPDYQNIKEVLRLTYEADPGLRALHDISADSAGECRFVFRHLFMDDSYDHNSYLPSYRKWFDQQSMEPVYEWYRDVLKLIQYPNDGDRRWILKYPPHFRCLKEIFTVFPDACIIQTHRDPTAVLPSFASLLTHFSSLYEENVDPKNVGAFVENHWKTRIAKGMKDREELNREGQFYDVQFDQVLSDPVATVTEALCYFDAEDSAEGIEAMTAWHQSHPPERHGKHGYAPEDFGMNEQALSDAFVAYRERFKVPSAI